MKHVLKKRQEGASRLLPVLARTQEDKRDVEEAELELRMKAIGYKIPSPISDQDSLIDIKLAKPQPEGRDILV